MLGCSRRPGNYQRNGVICPCELPPRTGVDNVKVGLETGQENELFGHVSLLFVLCHSNGWPGHICSFSEKDSPFFSAF